MQVYSNSVIQRFWSKVDKVTASPCWLWIGYTRPMRGCSNKFYGAFVIRRRKVTSKYIYSAHRVSWEIQNKRLLKPSELIRHTCGNSLCVNPAHLILGTQKENMRDRDRHGNTCRGEDSPIAILTNQDVIFILQCYKDKTITQVDLAKKYNVHKSTIQRIVKGKRWTHIWKEFHNQTK